MKIKKNNQIVILNSSDLSNCTEAIDILNSIGKLINVSANYEDVYSNIEGCHAYLCGLGSKIDKKLINKATSLKILATPSTGTDHIDLESLKKANIEYYSIKNEMELLKTFTATSEHTFGLALALNRQLLPANQSIYEGNWAREKYTGWQLKEKTCGILGLGRLGKISAKIAKGFGMRVIANDILNVKEDGVEMVEFDELLSESDMITIHVHLNDDTRHIIGSKEMESMKTSSILINTSRGALIDEKALLYALEKKIIAGAALDVIDGEWDESIISHPLIAYSKKNTNLVITPHIGGATHESIFGARIFMAQKIANYFKQSQ